MSRRLGRRLEAVLVRALLALLRALGPVRASNLGGAVARTIGPWLPVSRVAERNLRHAMPERGADERRRIIRSVWDNLGRTAAELPHLPALGPAAADGPGWEAEGLDILRERKAAGGPMILFSGHLGFWEMMPPLLARNAMPMASFYRAAANTEVDALINALRREAAGTDVPLFGKGAQGARAAMQYLGKGGWVGMLVDQKMNEGIEARLFGRPAMTATAAAAFALRFHCPLLPGHVVRVGPARWRLIVEPPLPVPAEGDPHARIAALTQAMNDCLERWIRERPEQWLWLHRRFPQEVYRT